MRYNSGTHEFGYHRLQDVFIKIIMNRHRTINLILVILFLLVYAASFQDKTTAQSDTIPSITINSGESIGQTFTSLHRGLNEITITLSSDNPVSGTLRFDLYQNEPDMLALSKEYSVSVSTPKVFILNFEPQTDSYLNDYFLNINWIGSGPVNFQTDVAEGYDQGSLYVNSSPVLAQLSFSLSYDSPQLTLGLALVMCKWFWQLFLTLLILLLPGWAVMTYCWSDWKEYNLFLRLALAFGFSYAIYPILFLLTDLINLHPGELFFVWAVVGVSFLSLLYYYWSDNRNRKPSVKRMINHLRENSDNWLSASFLLVLIIIFLVKCWAIRTLDTPMWGDSYQHTMITQLMINNNGLFDSWQPYVPYNSLTVHFGFHALSAVFAWISGLNASQSILWIGQISNMLAALSLYPITFKISGNNKWAGMIAVIIAALVLKYPNYYVNWGRYAQLSGQVLLPLVGFLLIEALFSNKTNIKNLTIVSVFLGGMALCYYRMPFFLIIWIPILVGEALVWFRKKENRFLQLVIRGAFILLGMLVLLVPVFFRISGGKLAESVGPIQSPSVNNAVSLFIRNLRSTQEYYAQSLIIWAVMSVMIALLIKQWRS